MYLAPDHVGSLVELWLGVDVSVACFCDGSDAPLHVLSVELELCFGDVVVELLDGLGAFETEKSVRFPPFGEIS